MQWHYAMAFSTICLVIFVSDFISLPKPTTPTLPGVNVYSMDAFIIAVVAFSQCVSLAAIMAKKHNYTFDANQVICLSQCFKIAATMAKIKK